MQCYWFPISAPFFHCFTLSIDHAVVEQHTKRKNALERQAYPECSPSSLCPSHNSIYSTHTTPSLSSIPTISSYRRIVHRQETDSQISQASGPWQGLGKGRDCLPGAWCFVVVAAAWTACLPACASATQSMAITRGKARRPVRRHVLLLLGVSGVQLLALLVRQAGAFSPPSSTSFLRSTAPARAGATTRTQHAKSSSSWSSLLFPAAANTGFSHSSASFRLNVPFYATTSSATATAPPPVAESEQQQQRQQQQQQQASPPKEKVEALPRLGRVKAMSLLQSLVDDLRQQQGGDGTRAASSPPSSLPSFSPPSSSPSSVLDEEVEPFYALAQRCRQSDLPDLVLEVLNSYRAMASPGALSIGRPSLSPSLPPSLPPLLPSFFPFLCFSFLVWMTSYHLVAFLCLRRVRPPLCPLTESDRTPTFPLSSFPPSLPPSLQAPLERQTSGH